MELDEFLDQLSISNTQEIVKLANVFRFASVKHANQVRKGTGEPYIIYPIRVALQLKKFGLKLILAGLLHDVVEDSDATLADIEHIAGKDVAILVQGVTKNDESRDILSIIQPIIGMDSDVLLLKLADRLDNMTDHFEEMIESVRKKYQKETPILIDIAKNHNIEDFIPELQKILNRMD